MEIIHGKENEFESLISGELVLVDFYATWCGPCKMLGSVLEEVASERTDVKIVKMDVDECPELSKKYAIMSVPTLMLFKDGNVISTEHGFIPKVMLTKWLEENK